jgi:hypothetical protein
MLDHGIYEGSLKVASLLANGTLHLPARTSEVIIEIGANSRNTMDVDVLPNQTRAFLLTFEPILDKYAALLARSSKPDTKTPSAQLGFHHDRGLVLPYAIGSEDGHATFHLDGELDGCASLLEGQNHQRPTKPGATCGSVWLRRKDERRVPTVTLHTVLNKWLAWADGGGWPISFLKVDAQGFDLQAVLSAGPLINRLRVVQLEVQRDTCHSMYVAAPNCSTVVQTMKSHGFLSNKQCHTSRFLGYKRCESNFMFFRRNEDWRRWQAFNFEDARMEAMYNEHEVYDEHPDA